LILLYSLFIMKDDSIMIIVINNLLRNIDYGDLK